MGWRSGLQTIVQTLYPSSCLNCGVSIESQSGLCSKCWLNSPFIAGLVCNYCGAPLPGKSAHTETCDDCLASPRPWTAARACLLYQDNTRKLIWDLKYGDRSEIATAAGGWLFAALQPILPQNPLLVPVPLHWTRLLRRKYNQSALLSKALADTGRYQNMPDALKRVRRTPSLAKLDYEERQACLKGAIQVNQAKAQILEHRNIVLIDDVMTTGATLSAAAEALKEHSVGSISAVFVARAVKSG
ncbi:ComF family protein [Lentibacter algarum]|nr:ComF family protein [Lentibacter algarum]MBU2981079.1 ComF family protein [Lentibacter algarum]